MANFIPPLNGTSLGNYLVKKLLFWSKKVKNGDKNSYDSQTCKPLLKWLFFSFGQPHEGAPTEEHPGNLTILEIAFCFFGFMRN